MIRGGGRDGGSSEEPYREGVSGNEAPVNAEFKPVRTTEPPPRRNSGDIKASSSTGYTLWWTDTIGTTNRLHEPFSLAIRKPDIIVHHGFCNEASIGRGHKRHGENVRWRRGERPRCPEEGRRETGGTEATGGREEGQTRSHGGRKGKGQTDHTGQVWTEEERGEGGRGESSYGTSL